MPFRCVITSDTIPAGWILTHSIIRACSYRSRTRAFKFRALKIMDHVSSPNMIAPTTAPVAMPALSLAVSPEELLPSESVVAVQAAALPL
jgi:hypothetical protein